MRVLVRLIVATLALAVLVPAAGPAAAADPPGTVVLNAPGKHVYNLALSPGRVTWIDDSVADRPVRKAGVTVSGDILSLGTPSLIGLSKAKSYFEGTVVGLSPTGASGVRTLWGEVTVVHCYENGIICWVDGEALRLSKGSTTSTIAKYVGDTSLSGTRAVHGFGAAPRLYDLDSRTTTDLAKRFGPLSSRAHPPVSLWGNYLTLMRPDGSILRKNLSSSAKAPLVAAVNESIDGYIHHGYLSSWGDWVGWTRYYWKSGQLVAKDCGIRNMATAAPSAGLSPCPQRLTSAGALLYDNATKLWSLYRYDGSTVDLPVPAGSKGVSIEGEVLAWVESDGTAKLAPLPDAPANPPRSLGNPIVGETYKVGGASWSLDLVTSARLSTCQVKISRAGTDVRTLTCSAGALSSGEVMARWDGKDDEGHPVSAGTYKWTIVAGNDAGALLRSDGVDKTTTGSIAVS